MTKLVALITVFTIVAGCSVVDYGAVNIQTKPSVAGCPQPNSPCAPGGKGL